jgi:tetratricopeptide (TPR) repeat protein
MEYTDEQFKQTLRRFLSPDDANSISNPLATTSEMKTWAAKATAGITNAQEKAFRLFQSLTNNESISTGTTGGATSRTAQQAFGAWKTQRDYLSCGDYAILYASLARCVGLNVFVADVVEPIGGSTGPHACAAVFLGEKMLLVDLTFRLFGAPHKRFTVLDDLQTTGCWLAESLDIRRSEMAIKLAPDLTFVQYRRVGSLLYSDRLNEARLLISRIRQQTEPGANLYVESYLALYSAESERAVLLLLKAIARQPSNGVLYAQLAEAYAQQGRLGSATEALRAALASDLSAAQSKMAQSRLAETNAVLGWGMASYAFGLLNRAEWNEAVVAYDHLVSLGRGYAPGYYGRAIAKQSKGDLEGALADYKEAIRLEPALATSIQPLCAQVRNQLLRSVLLPLACLLMCVSIAIFFFRGAALVTGRISRPDLRNPATCVVIALVILGSALLFMGIWSEPLLWTGTILNECATILFLLTAPSNKNPLGLVCPASNRPGRVGRR